MELAVGAMASLAPSLGELLKQEYVAQKGLKPGIESLCRELVMMKAAIADASEAPPGQLSNVDKLWARKVQDLSYDMEDAVDDFMTRVAGPASNGASVLKRIAAKATAVMRKAKDGHQLADKIEDIKRLSKELSELRARYAVRGPGASLAASIGIDPRVLGLYKKESDLVGIEEARDKVIRILTKTSPYSRASDQTMKIVSIVGVGGLGKTTLAKTVFDTIKEKFDCSAFFSVGRTPNMARTFERLLLELDQRYDQADMARWDLKRFCDELHKFLQNKRYFIVVDDIWDSESWMIIRGFLKDNDYGRSRIIMTTRNFEVITEEEEVYRLKPLSSDKSNKLFYRRVQSQEGEGLDNLSIEVSSKIIDKCGGIPLAIIAVASLLADKPCQEWTKVHDSIGFGKKEDSAMRILSYSYYDLPFYLKPCLLYLSIFPEDFIIDTYELVWMWIAEGFVHVEEEERSLLKTGERYFNELVNRSMIQLANKGSNNLGKKCLVHDIVLDLIRKLSREENFVTILSKEHNTSSGNLRGEVKASIPCSDSKARRLTIQNCHVQHIPENTMDRPEMLRSLYILRSGIENMDPLCSFRACRVLFVRYVRVQINLKHLGKLRHLKCLVIYGKLVNELSNEIGHLKSLQTLVLVYANENCLVEKKLLLGICSLTQLLCLKLKGVQLRSLPVGRTWNLVSLEQLELHSIAGQSATKAFVVELRKLTRLRALNINFSKVKPEESLHKALVQSLCSLQGLQELILCFASENVFLFPGTSAYIWELWQPPRELRHLHICGISFSRCPAWINSSCLPCLWYLYLNLYVVELQDLDNLAKFPELRQLTLCGATWLPMYIVGANGFRNLKTCYVQTLLKFDMCAMPRLEELNFRVSAAYLGFVSDGTGSLVEQFQKIYGISDLDFGLDKLRSLEQVTIQVDCYDATLAQVQDTEAAVRRALEDHPNRPTLKIERLWESNMLSDQQYYEKVRRHDREFLVSVQKIKDDEVDVGFIEVLRSPVFIYLQRAVFSIDCAGVSMWQVEKVEAALRHAADAHHNHPTLRLIRINIEEMTSSPDHLNTEVM